MMELKKIIINQNKSVIFAQNIFTNISIILREIEYYNQSSLYLFKSNNEPHVSVLHKLSCTT